jgi:RimK family alpha-L-glutamate ligase
MDLLIFAKKDFEAYAVPRLRQEARKLGLKHRVIRYEEIAIEFKGGKVSFFHGRQVLPTPKMAIFRVAGRGGAGEHFVPQRTILLQQWAKEPVAVMNHKTYLAFPRLNKLWQHYWFAQAGLPYVPSENYGSLDLLKPKSLKFPLIVKNRYGSGGLKVFKADSPMELRNLLLEDVTSEMIQPFLPTGYDFRVIVIGGKALGAMKKSAPKGEFLTNIVRGGTATQAQLTKELRDLAVKAARLFNADYVGVDIMYDQKGNPYLLEVNRGAQFEGFETSTGINVAREMIEWLTSKRERK